MAHAQEVAFQSFLWGLNAADNHLRADRVWGGGKRGQLISPTPSLSCPQYMGHVVGLVRPLQAGSGALGSKRLVEGPKSWIWSRWAFERGGKTHPEQIGRQKRHGLSRPPPRGTMPAPSPGAPGAGHHT